ncbi:MAG: hypothetical protein KGL01_10140 [Betaproteobacteria bacterium]|nr:hypothetical protein [Betaproteobacteria bacterium]
MFSITSQVADAIYSWSNVLLVLGATLALVGTAGVFWSGGVREKFADERISANEAETAKAKAETARAMLEQERLKEQLAWREVTPEQAKILQSQLKILPMQITISWVSGDPEGSAFAQSLGNALLNSGLEISAFAPMGFLGEEPHGLSISGSERREVELLASVLGNAGFGSIKVHIDNRKPDGSKYFTHLLIGYRSQPLLVRVTTPAK